MMLREVGASKARRRVEQNLEAEGEENVNINILTTYSYQLSQFVKALGDDYTLGNHLLPGPTSLGCLTVEEAVRSGFEESNKNNTFYWKH